MARVDNLENFFTDVADSIRSKTGKSEAITPADFDTEIESIESESKIYMPAFNTNYMTLFEGTGTSITASNIQGNVYEKNELFKRETPRKGLVCFFTRSNCTIPDGLTLLTETDWFFNDTLRQKLFICWCEDLSKTYTITQETQGRIEAYSIMLVNTKMPTNVILNKTLNITEETNTGNLEVNPTNKMCIYICSSIYNYTDNSFYFDKKFDFSDYGVRLGIFISTNNNSKKIATCTNSYGVIGLELEYDL